MIDVRIALLLIGLGVLVALFASTFAGGVIAAVGVGLLVLDLLNARAPRA